MADDFVSNPGVGGVTFASDEVSSKHYPRLKLIHGADGVNAGDVAVANPFPTQASIETNQMTAGGTVVTPKFAIIDAASSGDNTLVAR